MIRQLPQFKGYTIDARLKELRWFDSEGQMHSASFDDADEILSEYINTLDTNSDDFQEIAEAIL